MSYTFFWISRFIKVVILKYETISYSCSVCIKHITMPSLFPLEHLLRTNKNLKKSRPSYYNGYEFINFNSLKCVEKQGLELK